ncbi:hypothetical protein [Sphingobium sp. HWE2-09]|nr:hypothetical protein [Sphingobium sp. HWE2-09]
MGIEKAANNGGIMSMANRPEWATLPPSLLDKGRPNSYRVDR